MRYLTLAAGYTQSPIRDDFEGPVEVDALGLSKELTSRLDDWSNRYRAVIPLGPEQRKEPPAAQFISDLDDEGRDLALRVAEELGDAKVRYYSEGHLRYEDTP